MAEFNYLKSQPAPTDRWVIPIYKEFIGVKAEILESWKRGVVNQLMTHREYADIVDSRLSVKHTKKGIVPVISLKPVVGFENEARLRGYMEFFATYEMFRYRILETIDLTLSTEQLHLELDPDADIIKFRKSRRRSDRVIFLTNVIKLIISAQRSGVFVMSDFDNLEWMNKPRMKEFHVRMVDLGLGHTVGDMFIETGDLTQDVDSDLIGAFYQYTRKLQASLEG